MQRIGDSTTTANGAKEFTQGQPGSGVDATIITVAWLNAIQRELVNVLVGAGLTVLPDDDSQLFKAIQALLVASSTWAKLSGKPSTIAGFGITDAFTKAETNSAIQQKIAGLVDSSPAALDTLNELAAALGNDPNFATTMTNALAGKASRATTLAGYGITDAIKLGAYGLGDALALPGGTDLNTIIQPGIYFYGAGDNPVNVPMAGACYLEVVGRYSYPHQVFRRLYQNRFFTRAAKVTNPTAAPADWEAWVEDAHTGNLSQLLRTTDAVATETLLGVIRGATQNEVDAGLLGGLAVTPLTLKKHSSIGVGQTWQDLTASRSGGTTYTNTTGRPIFVVINTPSNTAITATVGGVTIYGSYTPSSGQPRGSLGFIVPPGGTYSSTASSGFSWLELR